MKTINITKKKTMNLPAAFTMHDLAKANPSVKAPTLYQRVQTLLEKGEIVIKGDYKTPKQGEGNEKTFTKGRAAIVYALPDTKDGNKLITKAIKQGEKRQGKKQVVTEEDSETTVESMASTETENAA